MAGSEGFRKFAARHNEASPIRAVGCLPPSLPPSLPILCYTFQSVINTPCKRLGDTRLRSLRRASALER